MKDLTEGSVIKHLLHMSAFMAVSMFVQTLYLLADLYWVGHLGKEAIAAVGAAVEAVGPTFPAASVAVSFTVLPAVNVWLT